VKLPYIKTINLTKNYVYLTDKLMGVKILGEDNLSLKTDYNTVYKVELIGKTKPGEICLIDSGSYYATNKIVRIGNAPIHAFINDKKHSSIYITDLFVPTRSINNIYNENYAFFSAIINLKDKARIENKYNKLTRLLEDLPF